MRITSIHQPHFFPWLGLLDKISKSNHFVFLDHATVNKGTNQYRNTFFCNGETKHITLPVTIGLDIPIVNMEFKNDLWVEDHLNKFLNYYRKAKHFDEIYPLLFKFYSHNSRLKPIEVIINSMLFLFQLFEIEVAIDRSSTMECIEKKGNLVLEICKKSKTELYLSGLGAKNYMDEIVLQSFEQAGINISWHKFTHPVYKQDYRQNFVEGLSSLDILFFNGIEVSRNIFWTNVRSAVYEDATE